MNFGNFVAPAMLEKETQICQRFYFLSLHFFFLSAYCLAIILSLPLSINFLGNYQVSEQVFNDFDLSSYISLIRASVLACGLVFELPIIIFFLAKLGIVTPESLRKYRKFSLVAVLILSAIITPPDIVSQIIVAIPIMILYEVSIVIAKVVVKKER